MLKILGQIIIVLVIGLNVLAFVGITSMIDPYTVELAFGIKANFVAPMVAALLTVAALFEMAIGLILIAFYDLCQDTRKIKEAVGHIEEAQEDIADSVDAIVNKETGSDT